MYSSISSPLSPIQTVMRLLVILLMLPSVIIQLSLSSWIVDALLLFGLLSFSSSLNKSHLRLIIRYQNHQSKCFINLS